MSPDFSDPHFIEPLRLWAAPPLILAFAGLWAYASRRRDRAIAGIASPVIARSLLAGHSPRRRAFKYALLVTAAVLLVVALARPCWGFETAAMTTDAEDVVFVLDTSRSMTARDVPPDRLSRAKRAIATFVGMHPSGRIGLVAFAGEAFLQCPPTGDRDIFNETLDAMDTEVIPRPGTDIGGALDAGFAAFGDNKTDDKGKKPRRTLVLLTDGEGLDGNGVEVAKKLARDGVRIHTVGIGTDGYEIPRNADGTGGSVVTKIDEKTLRDIAAATGGEYFRLDAKHSGFGLVEARLGRLASSAGGARTPTERFPFPLALAALILAVEATLGTRRSGTAPFVPAGKLAAFGVALLFAAPVVSHAESPENLYDRAADALKRESWSEAESYLKTALEDADANLMPPALHNLGQARARAATKVTDSYLLKTLPSNDPAATRDALKKATGPVDESLAAGELGALDRDKAVRAYLGGQAALKNAREKLKTAREQLAEAEEGVAKLTRARDDFLGAVELDPKDTDAKRNADAIDAYLKKAKERLAEAKQAIEDATRQMSQLTQKLKKLRRMITGEGEGSGSGGEEDEDENPGKKKGRNKEDSRSEEQRRRDEGDEGKMSSDEARAALEGMRRGLKGRVPSGYGQPTKETSADGSRGSDR